MSQILDGEMGCITCTHVLAGADVLFVSHAGGDWVFICGAESHYSNDEDISELTAVHVSHLLQQDPGLCEVLTLPVDMSAIRDSKSQAWRFEEDAD